MADEIEAQMQIYIDYLLLHPDAADEVVVSALREAGVGEHRAFEVVAWVPIAFGRAVLEGPDFRRPSTFQRMSADGQKFTRRRFADEPVFVEACRLATGLTSQGFPKKDFLLIAGRSAEFRAVNDALLGRSELKNLEPAEPVVSLPDNSPEPRRDARRPSWKFW